MGDIYSSSDQSASIWSVVTGAAASASGSVVSSVGDALGNRLGGWIDPNSGAVTGGAPAPGPSLPVGAINKPQPGVALPKGMSFGALLVIGLGAYYLFHHHR